MSDIVPFSERKVSTVTMLVGISDIDYRTAFWWLPWSFCPDFKKERKASKGKKQKNKLEDKERVIKITSLPGTIATLKIPGKVRGTVVTKPVKKRKTTPKKKQEAFQHSCTINICNGKKFPSLKIYKNKVHVTGVQSQEEGNETVQLLLNQIKKIHQFRQGIDEEKHLRHYQWICDNYRGEKITRKTISEEQVGESLMVIEKDLEDYLIIQENLAVPEDLDSELINFYLSYRRDEQYFNDFQSIIYYLFYNTPLYEEEPKILDSEVIMCNYNYSLNYYVSRVMVKRIFHMQDSFLSTFDNDSADGVKIELAYEPEPRRLVKKKKKISRHTFLVYCRGSVTQSGPGGIRAEEAYYRFMRIISQHEQDIKIPTPDQ